MSDIIPFPTSSDWPELDGLTEKQLKQELSSIWERLALLDFEEPDSSSDQYEAWCEEHEDLEDMADEIQDRLDSLEDC